MLSTVPPEWQMRSRRITNPPYWVTYYGDIYSGIYEELFDVDDRFFIISFNELKEFRDLKERTIESYNKLGWEIKDPKIISKYFDGEQQLGESPTSAFFKSVPQECKKVFIFGAGASSNCISANYRKSFQGSELKPPDAAEVFGPRFNSIILNYKGVLAAIPSINHANNDVEAAFENDWGEIRDKHSPHLIARHINVQYYLQELFTQISQEIAQNHFRGNLYQTLVDKVLVSLKGEERASFISFNYDTILDTSLERTLGEYKNLSDYIDFENRKIMLFKPHGSCNWGWPFQKERIANVNGGNLQQYLYENKVPLSIIYYHLLGDFNRMVWEGSWGIEKALHKNYLGRFSINKNRIEVIHSGNGKKYFPALQLPYRDKDELVMPYDHYEALTSVLQKAEDIFLIGWKGNEELFNRILKSHANRLKKVVIVNPDSNTVREYLKSSIDISKDSARYEVVIFEDFEDFVLNKISPLLQ